VFVVDGHVHLLCMGYTNLDIFALQKAFVALQHDFIRR
jgi:hypothetical protein